MFRDRGVEIKTPDQIERMRAAGLVVGRTLELLRDATRPGVTTRELDALAAEHIRDSGALPSFLGYGRPPFPATTIGSTASASPSTSFTPLPGRPTLGTFGGWCMAEPMPCPV